MRSIGILYDSLNALHISGWGSPVNAKFNKIDNISRPHARNVQGVGESGRVNYLEGLVFYQSDIAGSPHVRKLVR